MEVQHQIYRATNTSRKEALKSSIKKSTDRIPMVVAYHPDLGSFNKILHNHLPNLHISEKMKLAVPIPPLAVNLQPKNLKDLLVRAMQKPQQHHRGSYKYGRPCCKSCVHIKSGTTFSSAITKENFQAHVDATCKTRNVI